MKRNNPSKATEFMWIAIAVMSAIAAVHKTYNHGISNSWLFYGFVFIALIMYLIRKNMRMKDN